ncbi:glycosyltransferase [Thomasclavelia sp.]|uniref:glycosyltransferase n=1 Tax=Thomasclavelia sp. TaxID=3025757 RepID=UPI0025D57E3A|nr:glycosyltransferase [Thomasclavelia sp.]
METENNTYKKISVIVPIYNAEKYLFTCLNSIVNQSYSNLEIILIDDGSIDNSLNICNEFAAKDKRIKVIHKDNQGVSAARNDGIEYSSGYYIAFVDSDDYLELDMYERMMKINNQYDCDIVMCDCYKENNEKKEIFTHSIREGFYNHDMLVKEYFPTLLMTNSVDYPPTISNWVCLFKRKVIIKHKIRYKAGMRFSEDLLFGSQFMYYANSFYYMKNQCLYHYVLNENSVTHTYYKDKWKIMKQLYLAIDDFFRKVTEYDFQREIDLSLLYIVYHCIGNIKNSLEDRKIKKCESMNILNDKYVKDMFKRIKINSLDINWKLKVITYIYKYRLYFLIRII